ncbi:MAG TPA: hypothetical protein VLQ20_10115 [Planococcus sp. (in: firmicutes)]|nr:hypothetical protein [Planococcus sp. (in: firmicutes)]
MLMAFRQWRNAPFQLKEPFAEANGFSYWALELESERCFLLVPVKIQAMRVKSLLKQVDSWPVHVKFNITPVNGKAFSQKQMKILKCHSIDYLEAL